MRATGDNPQMIRALGVNVENMIVLGLVLSNALVASPALCLPSIRDSRTCRWASAWSCGGSRASSSAKRWSVPVSLGFVIVGAVMGSVLFRLLVALALRGGLDPNDLKLVTAVFVFLALSRRIAARVTGPSRTQGTKAGAPRSDGRVMPDLRDASSVDRSERPGEAMLEFERLSKTFNPASPERGQSASRRRPDHCRRILRRRRGHERFGQIDVCSMRWPEPSSRMTGAFAWPGGRDPLAGAPARRAHRPGISESLQRHCRRRCRLPRTCPGCASRAVARIGVGDSQEYARRVATIAFGR